MDTTVVLRMHIVSHYYTNVCLKKEFILSLRLWSYFEIACRLCYGILMSEIVTGALIRPKHPGLYPMPTVACPLPSVQKDNRGGCLHSAIFTSLRLLYTGLHTS